VNFLTRLRGLQAPVAGDEPFRLADSGSAIPSTGGGGGSTIIIARNMRDVRRYSQPPGGPLAPTGVPPGVYTSANITVGADGRLTAAASGGGGGAGGLPGTIPDLQFWFESDNILATAGNIVAALQDRTPWQSGIYAASTTNSSGTLINSVIVDATGINGLPALKFPAAVATGIFTTPFGFQLSNGGTFFCVVKPAAATSLTRCLFGGNNSALSLFLQTTASVAKFGLVKSGVAVIGTATNVWTAGTAMQINATYNPATGAFAFRQARATNGSGTSATTAIAAKNLTIGSDVGGTSFLNADVMALLIAYNRVLSGTEIANVEAYILAKWGV
jgi:hypothetical protein